MARLLLILVLIQGLAPGIGELVETVVHRISTGHFAHAPNDPHDESSSTSEHGCGATAHRCQCCPTLAAVARSRFAVDRPKLKASDAAFARIEPCAEGVIAGVFRPPIA